MSEYTWREAGRTWQFWLLYGTFVVVNDIGLMIVGKSVAFAEAAQLPATAVMDAASLVALGDRAGVIAGGVVPDRFGREPRSLRGSWRVAAVSRERRSRRSTAVQSHTWG
jgi:hypothetical protein